MGVDLLYLAWNRYEFTKFTFEKLLANTDWSLIEHLHVYDDASEDGTAEWLAEAVAAAPCPATFHPCHFRSPVATMNHYIEGATSDLFFKIDSDVCCPPGWAGVMLGVIERNRELELLGAEPGFSYRPRDGWDGVYTYEPARHIGGVGLMRTSAFQTRYKMQPNGRYGASEWQHEYHTVSGWLAPEIDLFSLDHLPFEPWLTLADAYVDLGWSRPWPKFYSANHALWDWAFSQVE